MIGETGDIGDLDQYRKERRRQEKEARQQTAIAFVEHLERVIARSASPDTDSIQISKKDLYKDFTYPPIARKVWLGFDKKNYAYDEQAHYCALKEKYIEIDESVRPYRYRILDREKPQFQLRPYQEYIIEDTTKAKGSVLIEAPTGSGKSVIANEIARKEAKKGGRVLIVAPKIILLEQLKETFAALDPQIIHGARDYDKSHNVFISTIQTAHKRDLGFEPSMILIDEVHYGFSGKMIKKLLETFDGRLIGLSATPYDEKGVALQGFDMHIDRYNLRFMLENGYLLPPKCYAPLKVDLSAVGTVGGDYNQSDLDREFNNLESIGQIVESTKETIEKRKASLIFCINIAHSEAVAKAFSDAGIPTKAIHSKLGKEEQKAIMDAYKNGEIKMLANPMMLTTGFDHPATDTVILARATKSQNLYRQMVGRALRLSEGKEDAVVLDCSGVIGKLGLPTEDIKRRENTSSRAIRICAECKSEKLYKKIKDSKAYLCCANCGHCEDAMENGYECENCGLVHSAKSKFKTIDGSLYLVCDACHHETLVSEASSKEEMSLIFDPATTQSLQSRITLLYYRFLMDKMGPSFIFTPEAIKHARALQSLIMKDPSLSVGIDTLDFSYYSVIEENGSYTWIYYNLNDWRLFEEKWEDELLNEGLKELKERLKDSTILENSLTLIQSIYKITGKEPLDNDFIGELQEEVKKSKLSNIEAICNKRIKDLCFNDEDLYEMGGFVKMMESVLG